LVYVRGLKFDETPDYTKLRELLRKPLTKTDYDWPELPAVPAFFAEKRQADKEATAAQGGCGCFSIFSKKKP
jgi:hypothetical protein